MAHVALLALIELGVGPPADCGNLGEERRRRWELAYSRPPPSPPPVYKPPPPQ
jgi:hypothetical protein